MNIIKKSAAVLAAVLIGAVLSAQVPTGGVKGTVINRASRTPVEGANLVLKAGAVEIGTIKTDAQGNVTFERLPYGTYYVKETSIPEGHTVEGGNGWTVTVSADTIDANKNVTKEVVNKVTASRVELTKYVGNYGGATPTAITTTADSSSLAAWICSAWCRTR